MQQLHPHNVRVTIISNCYYDLTIYSHHSHSLTTCISTFCRLPIIIWHYAYNPSRVFHRRWRGWTKRSPAYI